MYLVFCVIAVIKFVKYSKNVVIADEKLKFYRGHFDHRHIDDNKVKYSQMINKLVITNKI